MIPPILNPIIPVTSRRENITIHPKVILAMDISRLNMGIPCLWDPKNMLKRQMFDSFAILSGGILRNDVILQKCPGWCGQANLYMSPV